MSNSEAKEYKQEYIDESVDAPAEPGLYQQEPLNSSQIRPDPIYLSSIKDLSSGDIDAINSLSIQTSGVSYVNAMDMVAGDLVCYVDNKTLYVAHAKHSTNYSFAHTSTYEEVGVRIRCGTGMVIDSIVVLLSKFGTPTGTITPRIFSNTSYNVAGRTPLETSNTSLDVTTLTTSLSEQTFTFDGNCYRGDIWIEFTYSGTTDGANYLKIGADTSMTDENIQGYKVDISGANPDRFQLNDFYCKVTGTYDGVYTIHHLWYDRRVIIGEVIADSDVGESPEVNTTNARHHQSGLTIGSLYYLGPEGITATTTDYLLGYAVKTTIMQSLIDRTTIVPSDALIADSGTLTSTSVSTSYVKYVEFVIQKSGTYRVFAQIFKASTSAYTASGRIYKNGSAYGTEFTNTSTSVSDAARIKTLTEDLAFDKGDLVQFYIKTSNASFAVRADTMKIYGSPIDVDILPLPLLILNQ